MNRNALKERRKVRQIIDRAVQKAHVPGQPSLGSSGTATAIVSGGLETVDYANEDGDSVRSFMLGVDALGDPNRPLSVTGKRINYYG